MSKLVPFFVFLCAATVHAQNMPPLPPSVVIDGYAAKVNDRVITRGDVHEAMAPLLPELYRTYQGDELDSELEKAYRQVLNELVERTLILEAFKAKGGALPDQYVNEELKRIINERFKGDEAQFVQVLAEQKKTRAEFIESIRDQMTVGMMVNEEVTKRARVTPEEVRKAYEDHKKDYFIPAKVKYSVIVLNKGATEEDQAVKLAEAQKIRERLLEGEDFAETAKTQSEGSRAAEGGSFPWMEPKDVRPELQETLETLPAGEISPIIETDKQLYIVKVEARQEAGYKGFDEVRNDIKNELVAQERERLHKRWIERLKESNYVRIYGE